MLVGAIIAPLILLGVLVLDHRLSLATVALAIGVGVVGGGVLGLFADT